MEIKTTKTDEANSVVTAIIDVKTITSSLEKIAQEASKTMDIQGFRKGKVPVAIVKQRYGTKLTEDAQNEALREVFRKSIEDLGINSDDLVGEPAVTKFDKKDDGSIEVEIKISSKPVVNLGDYKALLPEVKTKKVTAKEIDERITQMASGSAPLAKIKRKRKVKAGDFAIIDFEGFKDGVAFDGGKGEKHSLEIGSKSFIPGFEDQVIGMSYDEEKEITVTFPKEYQAKDLAGAEVIFKVKLHEIQEKAAPTIDDEFAKKVLPQEKDATVDVLKEKIKEQIKSEKTGVYYNDELKPAYTEALNKAIDFAVPQNILSQEIDQILNNQIRNLSEDEIKELSTDAKKIEQMRKDIEPEAKNNVKITFIIDALAKAESTSVSDQEVQQTIYYEAMMNGQDGQIMIKQYEEQGLLPVIKMSMLEQKVITKLLDESKGK